MTKKNSKRTRPSFTIDRAGRSSTQLIDPFFPPPTKSFTYPQCHTHTLECITCTTNGLLCIGCIFAPPISADLAKLEDVIWILRRQHLRHTSGFSPTLSSRASSRSIPPTDFSVHCGPVMCNWGVPRDTVFGLNRQCRKQERRSGGIQTYTREPTIRCMGVIKFNDCIEEKRRELFDYVNQTPRPTKSTGERQDYFLFMCAIIRNKRQQRFRNDRVGSPQAQAGSRSLQRACREASVLETSSRPQGGIHRQMIANALHSSSITM